jgi:hypothetical protein
MVKLDQDCKELTDNPAATAMVDVNADDFCKQTRCKVDIGDRKVRTYSYTSAPGDHTPCGVGGRCFNGECANNTENPMERLDLNKMCVKKTNKPDAQVFSDQPPNEMCGSILKCKDGKGIYTFRGQPMPENAFPCGPNNGVSCRIQ